MRRARTQAARQLRERITHGERLLREYAARTQPEAERVCSILRAELERQRQKLEAILSGG